MSKYNTYKYYCLLEKKEYKLVKDNPHCIQYFCNYSNITDNKPKDKIYYEYERSYKGDMRKKNLKDIEDKKKPINKSKLIEIIDDKFPQVQYRSRKQRPTTNLHHGQLKLFLSTLQFILYYGDKINDIVYAGSSPGTNIYIFLKMFPKKNWYLIDPRDHNKKLYESKNVKEIKKEYFTLETAEYYKKKFKNKKFLFISDIRSEESEERVIIDNKLQMECVEIMQPEYSQLKFKIPYSQKEYEYLDGDIYIQFYPPVASNETRLVIKKGAKRKTYILKDYESKLYYHNRVYRPSIYKHSLKTKCLDHCYDCTGFANLISLYCKKYKKIVTKTPDEIVENIDRVLYRKLSENIKSMKKDLKN